MNYGRLGRLAVWLPGALAGVVLAISGCSTPVGVEHVDPRTVHFELSSNVLSTGVPSGPAQIVLRQSDLLERFDDDPAGAPAAGTRPLHAADDAWDFVAPQAKVPVTALLRIDDVRRQLATGSLRASLTVYAANEAVAVEIDGRRIPLEIEPTAAMAYALGASPVWEWEFKGFIFGDLFSNAPTQLAAIEPYRPGRFPVVFVHGTASSPGRWADMLNDLLNDPRIQKRFQFWFFFYNTGNPLPYSALALRDSLQQAVERLVPEGRDPALRHMVVIGHSQGGLLTKLTAVDLGSALWDQLSRKPLDELNLKPETRELLRRALFVKPLPFVKRLVFIATPHRGSYMAGNWLGQQIARLVRMPGNVLRLTTELMQNAQAFPAFTGRVGSVYAMTPGNPYLKVLASTPVAAGVAAHSIIAVDGDGPPEGGDDGVVEYSSAHLEGVESELIVRSGHSTQSNPHTIEEVRRILLLHAAEVCPEEIDKSSCIQ